MTDILDEISPGPWREEPNPLSPQYDWQILHSGGELVTDRYCWPDPETDTTVEADARLIAAAPELYAALLDIREMVSLLPPPRSLDENAMDRAIRLIDRLNTKGE